MLSRPVILLLATLLASCGASSSDESTADMAFAVDPNLLGEEFEDPAEGFSIRAPVEWTAVPESAIEDAMERVLQAADSGISVPRMLALYRHPDSGASLAVSRYDASIAAADVLVAMNEQGLRLREAHGAAQVMDARFTYGGFELDQWMVSGNELVLVKLLVRRGSMATYQLDYAIPRAAYETELPSLESSIGSMDYRPNP